MSLLPRDRRALEFPEGAEWLNVDRPLALEDLRGRVVLLDFWTFCCINCMHVIPDLRRLEERYPELVVIGVHSAKFHNEQVRQNVRHAVLRYGIEHPVVIDNDLVLWRGHGIRAWPSFVLIDPAGNVAGRASGEGPYDMFDDAIASLLEAFEGTVERGPLQLDLVRDREPGTALSYPGKLEVDRGGRRLFLSDSGHHRIVAFTPEGEVTQVIGSGAAGAADGALGEARFLRPQGMAYHPREDALYVADTENHLVRRVDLAAGEVRTVLGTGEQGGYATRGTGTDLALNSPWDLAIMGDHLYIAMAGPHQLWRMDLATLEAERYAGSGREDIADGPRERAALAQPSGIDTDGTRIFFADSEVSAVRVVQDDRVRTIVGEGLFEFGDVDGTLPVARFQHPLGVLHDGDTVLVADSYNHKVKLIDLELGTVHTLVGTGEPGASDGPGRQATLSEPNDVALLEGVLYIADTNNHLVRVFDPASDRLLTLRFANEEALWPGPEGGLRGREVVLGPVDLAPGEASVRLRLVAPGGHAWNPGAPHHLEVSADDDRLEVGRVPEADAGWDVRLPVTASWEGTSRLRFSAVAYFCEEEAPGLCRFVALELVLPINVTEGGASSAEVSHRPFVE